VNDNELTYKGRDYIYGFETIRDFPVRGKTSFTFFIKLKYGIKPFEKTKIIFREEATQPNKIAGMSIYISNLNDKKLAELVEKEIDKYIIISRRRKLKILNNK